MQADAVRHKSAKVVRRVNRVNVDIYNDKTTLTILGGNEGGISNSLLFRKWLNRKSLSVGFGN